MHDSPRYGIWSELEGQPVGDSDGNITCMTCSKDIDFPAGVVLHGVARTPRGSDSGWYIDGLYCDDHRRTQVVDAEMGRSDAAVVVKLGKRDGRYYAQKIRVKEVRRAEKT